MRVSICAVGRLKAGPEASLIRDYLNRFDRTGRQLGLGPADVIEIDERKAANMTEEAALLRKAMPAGALLCVLDERAKPMTSPGFADQISRWRDAGRGHVVFMIGGADGLHPDLRAEADAALSFGKMVWPHMLARVMLSEQIYRAATILAGSPYHRS